MTENPPAVWNASAGRPVPELRRLDLRQRIDLQGLAVAQDQERVV